VYICERLVEFYSVSEATMPCAVEL
jgi:hypothetical protein